MKPILCLFFLFSFIIHSQTDFESKIFSKILNQERTISIHLPKSYDDAGKKFPLFISLDGEYTKLVLNGTLDYYAYWEKIPECIVVSIDQNFSSDSTGRYQRWEDCDYNWNIGVPEDKGVLFKNFIMDELIPFVQSNYHTNGFEALVGHSFTANYVNYFLEEAAGFEALISLSPYFASNNFEQQKQIISKRTTPIYYFVAVGEKDLSGHIKSVKEFDQQFSTLKPAIFRYSYYHADKNGATHSSIIPIALPYAIEHVFSGYSPINEEEYKLMCKKENKVEYFLERNAFISSFYGIDLTIRLDDFYPVTMAIEKAKQWDQLKTICDLYIQQFPNDLSGYYGLGGYYEKLGDYNNALKMYELGYSKLGEDILNKADFYADIERIKKKIK